MTKSIVEVNNLNLYYNDFLALNNVNMKVAENSITALIGPSGCGKSTFLRTLNRMNDLIEGVQISGEIKINGQNINDSNVDVVKLRKTVGMVFQKPNPFPKSIFDNVAYAPRLHGLKKGINMNDYVKDNLNSVALWDEVKDRLHKPALGLSGGQQQRLCIARTLSIQPDIILMDEPTSALDPIATMKIEELIQELKTSYTIIIVTHNMQQAARIADYTGFFLNGQLIEFDSTTTIFTKPRDKRTEDYITGRFG